MPPIENFKRLDVKKLLAEGGEPLPVIRKKVADLREGEGLLVLAPFLPSPLIELLSSEGYASKVERGDAGAWIVYFWRREG